MDVNRQHQRRATQRASLHQRLLVFVGIGGLLAAGGVVNGVHADTFSGVTYDATHDELIVTMAYRGTNADHSFTLKWGICKTSASGTESQLAAEILDSQSQDPARQPFEKTTRFSLSDIPCRPVRLTLRTAPRFLYTLRIPAQRR
jgi:hypothetical protein